MKRFSIPRPRYGFHTLWGDSLGGVTAGVVSLPVALAFGKAAGLDLAAGIYGAIAMGFLATIFGGTRALISGPTGSMTVAVSVIVVGQHATDIGEAFTIVILAGLIQMMFGLLRIGRFINYTPYSVIAGFITGVAVIILSLQILPFLGAPAVAGGTVGVLGSLDTVVDTFEWNALVLGGITLAIALFWPRRLDKYMPSSLVALAIGSIAGIFWLTQAPTLDTITTGILPTLQMPETTPSTLAHAIEPALVIALVGSVDTLLTALVADSITRTRHDANRELLAQGISNVFIGFIRGLPGAGATPSTVANVRAGGRTVVSGFISVALLVVVIMGLRNFVALIPDAVLAGIMVKVALDTADWRFMSRIFRVHREHMIVMLLTFSLTVFLDILAAVGVGIIAAMVTQALQFERLELDSVVSVPLLDQSFFGTEGIGDEDDDVDEFSARVGLVSLRGTFTVASSGKLIDTIGEDIREHQVVILDFSRTKYMGDSPAMVIEQLIEMAHSYKTDCIVLGLTKTVRQTLVGLNVLHRVPDDQIVSSWDEARATAARLLAATPQPTHQG